MISLGAKVPLAGSRGYVATIDSYLFLLILLFLSTQHRFLATSKQLSSLDSQRVLVADTIGLKKVAVDRLDISAVQCQTDWNL